MVKKTNKQEHDAKNCVNSKPCFDCEYPIQLKYKVEVLDTKTYIVDVLATNEDEATSKAFKAYNQHYKEGTLHYYEMGDDEINVGVIYDVTDTDDPFNP
jgi:hypothetical protein